MKGDEYLMNNWFNYKTRTIATFRIKGELNETVINVEEGPYGDISLHGFISKIISPYPCLEVFDGKRFSDIKFDIKLCNSFKYDEFLAFTLFVSNDNDVTPCNIAFETKKAVCSFIELWRKLTESENVEIYSNLYKVISATKNKQRMINTFLDGVDETLMPEEKLILEVRKDDIK